MFVCLARFFSSSVTAALYVVQHRYYLITNKEMVTTQPNLRLCEPYFSHSFSSEGFQSADDSSALGAHLPWSFAERSCTGALCNEPSCRDDARSRRVVGGLGEERGVRAPSALTILELTLNHTEGHCPFNELRFTAYLWLGESIEHVLRFGWDKPISGLDH